MIRSEVHLQPAYILQSKKYRETSLILDVLTRDFGIVSLLAKGVRTKKSKTAGLLLSFSALKFSYIGENELKTLTYVELDSSNIKLSGISLYSGFYINELLIHFLHKYDPHPEAFYEYQQCLLHLTQTDNIEQILRFFELNLMDIVGYGVQLTIDSTTEITVNVEKNYYYMGEIGMVESNDGYVTGATLLDMAARKPMSKQGLFESKQLMRRIIDFHLQNKQLKSRAVLAQIIKNL